MINDHRAPPQHPRPRPPRHLLRQEISIEQVLDLLGFEPVTRTGAQLHGPFWPLPVHGSTSARSRSFSVNLRRRGVLPRMWQRQGKSRRDVQVLTCGVAGGGREEPPAVAGGV